MLPVNSKLSERLAILTGSLNIFTAAGTLTSALFNMAATTGNFFGRFLVMGFSNSTGAITFNVLKGTAAASAGTAFLTQTHSATTATVCLFDVNGSTQALSDTQNTFIGVQVINTNAGSCASGGYVLGGDGRYDPAQTWNANIVDATIGSVA